MTAHFFKRFGSRSELSLLMFHKILTQRVLSLDLSHDHCKAMLTIRKLDLDKKKKTRKVIIIKKTEVQDYVHITF